MLGVAQSVKSSCALRVAQSYELRKQSCAILELAQAKFRNPSCAIRPKSCAILVAQSGEVAESDFIPIDSHVIHVSQSCCTLPVWNLGLVASFLATSCNDSQLMSLPTVCTPSAYLPAKLPGQGLHVPEIHLASPSQICLWTAPLSCQKWIKITAKNSNDWLALPKSLSTW